MLRQSLPLESPPQTLLLLLLLLLSSPQQVAAPLGLQGLHTALKW